MSTPSSNPEAGSGSFLLSSPRIAPGARLPAEQVFNGFGCSGPNVSPALSWSGAPAGTQSYALTLYDPDAPTGSGWWHWIVYDLAPTVNALADGAGDASGLGLPAGAQHGRSDFGTHAFGGACPPEGSPPHRYIFTLYALDCATLGVARDASAALIGYMVHHHMLAKASFTALYSR